MGRWSSRGKGGELRRAWTSNEVSCTGSVGPDFKKLSSQGWADQKIAELFLTEGARGGAGNSTEQGLADHISQKTLDQGETCHQNAGRLLREVLGGAGSSIEQGRPFRP